MTTEEFISLHLSDDPRQVALRGCQDPSVDLQYALQQISGWQVARRKVPSWAATEGLRYPRHLSLEQCSSEQTARYKALTVRRLQEAGAMGDGAMADLTGGMGVDFSFMAPLFRRAMYVERSEELCLLATHNFPRLALGHATVVRGEAEAALENMEKVDFLFLDPARRDSHGGKTYALADCQPDVEALAPLLLEKAAVVMAKLSPMVDITSVCRQLPRLAELHVVSAGGECKELLAVMTAPRGAADGDNTDFTPSATTIFCTNDSQTLTFRHGEQQLPPPTLSQRGIDALAGAFLFEPNASLMKAGCHGVVSRRWGLEMVGANSHLFLSSSDEPSFHGRRFLISDASTMNRKELKHLLSGVDKANIAVRNFPLTAQQLRKKLQLHDGGDIYLFGTTLADGTHALLKCRKMTTEK